MLPQPTFTHKTLWEALTSCLLSPVCSRMEVFILDHSPEFTFYRHALPHPTPCGGHLGGWLLGEGRGKMLGLGPESAQMLEGDGGLEAIVTPLGREHPGDDGESPPRD